MKRILGMNSVVTLAFLACAGMCSPLLAELRLGYAWGDHMVLQAGKPLGVSGMADPGQAVTVEFGAGKASGRADAAGRWTVKLPAPKASSVPADLVVKAGRETLACRDVLVGQVWLCSGQSNMTGRWAGRPRRPRPPPIPIARSCACWIFRARRTMTRPSPGARTR